jgi:hypothetical protein
MTAKYYKLHPTEKQRSREIKPEAIPPQKSPLPHEIAEANTIKRPITSLKTYIISLNSIAVANLQW